MKTSFLKKTLLATIFMVSASSSYASLIYLGTEQFEGTGLGTVNTILTIQKQGEASGSVSFNGTTDVFTGDAKTGNSQTQTRTIAELGITSASDLRIVFNAAEPAGNSITLQDLQLDIYNSSGKSIFNSGAFTAQTFDITYTGTGSSGFVFGLDADQAAAAQLAAFTGNLGNYKIGLSATVTSAAGASETFFAINSAGVVPPSELPEPGSVALLGLGLLGFVAARRKAGKTKSA